MRGEKMQPSFFCLCQAEILRRAIRNRFAQLLLISRREQQRFLRRIGNEAAFHQHRRRIQLENEVVARHGGALLLGRKGGNERFLHRSGEQAPRAAARAVEHLRPRFRPHAVFVHVDGQHHVRLPLNRHIHAALHVLPLLRHICRTGCVVAEIGVCPAGHQHRRAALRQALFHLQRYGEVDLFLPHAGISAARAAVIAAVAGVNEDRPPRQAARGDICRFRRGMFLL